MTTPRPAPEAVEAAIIEGKADQRLSDSECERVFTHKGYWALPTEKLIAAGRILAAEVEWLRAEMDHRHREYGSALNRRVDVENTLAQFAAGKRDILSREEARELAVKLGVPPATKETK